MTINQCLTRVICARLRPTLLMLSLFFCSSSFLFVQQVEARVHDFSEEFESKISGLPAVLVKFYAPWCGHCKALAPSFTEASNAIDPSLVHFTFAEVDCTSEKAKRTCENQQIGGYPTMKLFRNGKFTEDYNGERTASAMVAYAIKQSQPVNSELKSELEFDAFINEDAAAADMNIIIAFLNDDQTASNIEKQFFEISQKLSSSIKFGYTRSAQIAAHADQAKLGQVYFYRAPHLRSPKLEPIRILFEADKYENDLNTFIDQNKHGLCGIRTLHNIREFKDPQFILFTTWNPNLDPKGCNYIRNRMLKVAKDAKQTHAQLTFSISDSNEFAYALTNQFGIDLSSSSAPSQQQRHFIGINSKGFKYVAPASLFSSNLFPSKEISQFIDDVLEGKIEAHIKSQPVPVEEKEGDVSVVVGLNANQKLIEQTDSDVLIEFYAPWCGHCKNLAPLYSKVGKQFESDAGIMIAKMDATANDYPSIMEVTGFPTIYFIRADQKNKPIRYDGDRSFKSIVDFVQKYRSTKKSPDTSKNEEL